MFKSVRNLVPNIQQNDAKIHFKAIKYCITIKEKTDQSCRKPYFVS